jgi:hypothetical protein
MPGDSDRYFASSRLAAKPAAASTSAKSNSIPWRFRSASKTMIASTSPPTSSNTSSRSAACRPVHSR